MVKKSLFVLSLTALAVVLFFSPNFKTIATGVAILLFGMVMLEEGFRVFTNGPLKILLKKATDKLYKSIATGALVTALIQSSSLVSVITISFISAGLISLSGGIGLIFGSNIGTTATAWLVAAFGLKIKISALAMPMLIFGLIFSFQKKESLKGIGNVLAGLGFFFLGIHFMKEGFDVFKEHIDLSQYAISGYLGVFVFTLLGIIITTILQSSSATLALILTALAAGQIEYQNALALAIGANIGTTITAILGSLSANVAGKRLAGAHLFFNLITGIIAIVFIYQISDLTDFLSYNFGIADTDYTLKLALFHTIFNIMGVLVMIPLIGTLERVLLKIFKDKEDKDIAKPKYLNEAVLTHPETLISSLLKESRRLYKKAIFEIVAHAMNIHRGDIVSEVKVKKVVKKSKEEIKIDIEDLYYKKVKTIYGEIILYATKGQSNLKLTTSQAQQLSEIKVANRKMVEVIRDTRELEKNVTKYLNSENKYIQSEYNKFRKKIVKVLRVIYHFRTEEEKSIYYQKLVKLKEEANNAIHNTNKSINKLIRKDLISPQMASSIVNDNDNVNDLIEKLISVAELLYLEKDSILEDKD